MEKRFKTWDDIYPEYENLSIMDKQEFIGKAIDDAQKDGINVPPNLRDASIHDMLDMYDKEHFLDTIGNDSIMNYIKYNWHPYDIIELVDNLNVFDWKQIITHKKHTFNAIMKTIKLAQEEIEDGK